VGHCGVHRIGSNLHEPMHCLGSCMPSPAFSPAEIKPSR